ncbi:hypothetical protein J5N97_017779 [Dioscorea zingiberensis]|uniref:Trichome birefringence-like N-terminal domain-containing protein n=1 Tax=Dioscorea zingiberensis TaxID=325984 RepID=A0A9D5HGN8_9LILI|nr:hypothetical protein J5N97_017779 [Dioscorea zingiberensis]
MGAVYQQEAHKEYCKHVGKKLILGAIYALLPLALLHSLLFRSIPSQHDDDQDYSIPSSQGLRAFACEPLGVPRRVSLLVLRVACVAKKIEEKGVGLQHCDYSNGDWVASTQGPKYNNTSCKMIRTGQNCLGNGRPDTGYLYWRWQPRECKLNEFDPHLFLKFIEKRHIAFIGDSLARNQLESLLCLLTTVSSPVLKYQYGEDNKFRRWTFDPPYNATISIYWSPFLVKAMDTTQGHNKVYMDSIDKRWASEINTMDMIIFSIGHWFNKPAIFYENGRVLGCHNCGTDNSNHTEVGIFDMMRKVTRAAIDEVSERVYKHREIFVATTTFSPDHFEGAWDKAGACPKVKPYEDGEKEIGYVEREMRRVVVEEVEVAAKVVEEKGRRIRFEILDVMKLASMRPDGHPGHYIHPYVMAKGYKGPFHNDCLHWCLPGPIDAWNEILLELIKRWEHEESLNKGLVRWLD